jgi:predicted nucleotide-binding protein
MAAFIDTEFGPLVDYLSSARVLHVTSFLDSETPNQLLKLLQKVKERSPRTVISFDPGHPWAVAPTPAVEGILRLSDFLLVNYREFKALGNNSNRDTDETVAARLLQRLKSRDGVLIVKRNDGVLSFRMENESVTQEHFAHVPLPTEEIRDATGAGDIFAAGLLAVITGHQFQVGLGSLLGMSLARHKLGYVGTQGHSHFTEITRSFIQSRDAERRRIALPRGVFIGHGGDPQWRSLKAFLEEECDLPVHAFESDPWGSKPVTEALTDYLNRCSFAVCVLTAEDLTQDGRRRARQNVIHEAGLFHGRYGYERVLLLVEEGCEIELNTAGIPSIPFPKNGIESAFWRLQKMIGRQGFTGSSS